MIGLSFERPPTVVLCLGAHPDDIEVGAAGLLRKLAAADGETRFVFAIASGDDTRVDEADASALDLLGDRVTVDCARLTDGFLPYSHAAETKEFFKSCAGETPPDLIISPYREDRHQDHRFVGELAHQVFRHQMILEYEIVKLEGDLGQPGFYVPLTSSEARAKIDHLESHFGSQHQKSWYDREAFSGLLRIRGVESRASEGFAEAFHTTRINLR